VTLWAHIPLPSTPPEFRDYIPKHGTRLMAEFFLDADLKVTVPDTHVTQLGKTPMQA